MWLGFEDLGLMLNLSWYLGLGCGVFLLQYLLQYLGCSYYSIWGFLTAVFTTVSDAGFSYYSIYYSIWGFLTTVFTTVSGVFLLQYLWVSYYSIYYSIWSFLNTVFTTVSAHHLSRWWYNTKSVGEGVKAHKLGLTNHFFFPIFSHLGKK